VIGKHLESGETQTMFCCVFTPDEAGVYPLSMEVGILDGGVYRFYESLITEVAVPEDTATLTDDIVTAIEILSVSKHDRSKVNKALKRIMDVQEREVASQKDIEQNIHDLLKAVDALLSITSADVSGIRLQIDALLGFWQGEAYFSEE
jgi:hypothetical protein